MLPYVFTSALSQNLTGNVFGVKGDGTTEPLINATLFWVNADIGTMTDTVGHFEIAYAPTTDKLVVSYTGYEDDTLTVRSDLRFINIVKRKVLGADSVVISVKQQATAISALNPQLTESLGMRELYKAACCNLGESFQSNASVDVSFNDAVSGAKQIRLLGLSGIYAQILTENTPAMRGLATAFGLGYIPGPWMERIDVSKGASSVINGYEGLTGQINIEYKKPEKSPKLFVNAYLNQMTRTETSVNIALPVNKSKTLQTMLLLHGNIIPMAMDRNQDGFADDQLQQQFAVHNRWSYFDQKGIEGQFSIKQVVENRQGGQLMHGDMPGHYKIGIQTHRTEFMTKNGWVNPKKPYQSVGFVTTTVLHQQKAFYGNRQYQGNEQMLNVKLLYESILGNTNHTFRTGVSYRFDNYKEKFEAIDYNLRESIPGVFGEYTYSHVEKLAVVAGMRVDYHNLYGVIPTPRVHVKYMPDTHTTLRASVGSGMRVPRIFADYTGYWVNARNVVLAENLQPEKGWNYGVSAVRTFTFRGRDGRISADFFRTDFTSQVVADRENATMLRFYNLKGKSFSHALQVEGLMEVMPRWEVKAAYKWTHVMMQYDSGLRAVPFVPFHRGFVNVAYTTRNEKWSFDATVQYTGKSRIPDLSENPAASQWQPYSAAFPMFFAQITHKWKKWDVYIGGENLNNFTQKAPIINVSNPFSQDFDATMVWGPIFGRTAYAGIRWTL